MIQRAKLKIYQLVVCSLVCVHAGEAFINQPGRCALQSRLCDTRMEVGSALRESGGKDEGMAPHKKHPHRKGPAGRGAGDWTRKRDCSKEDLAALMQLLTSEKECEREEERAFLYNRPILTLKPETGSVVGYKQYYAHNSYSTCRLVRHFCELNPRLCGAPSLLEQTQIFELQ